MGTSPFRLKGTGFVIGEGLIATNCHVLRKIARPEGNGWTLAGPALIDFADSAEHEPAREFRIEGIQAFPQVPYLDVAILRVAATSSNGANRLPARLRVQRTPFEIIEGQPDRLVAVIGYPDLDDVSLADPLTQNVYRRLREVGTVAQTLSLGAITGIDRHQGIDFVDHAASTHMGQSGSPVIDRNTGAVVAVHYCCANPNAPPDPSPLACSSQGLSDRENNEAVSMWTVVRDPILGPLFPLDAAASIPAILHGGPIRSTRR
jgi:V8-like Glu-specific endopeptidase